VLREAETPIDCVVQDGGSSDGSIEIIRNHADRLWAWDSAPDRGQADAIVKGFAKTTGGPNDVMAWINSDDFYLPGALRLVADYFAQHPEADVVYGHRIVVDEESREIARWFLPKHDDEVLRLNDFVPQETVFWRRRIWDKVGGIDTSFQFAMDWDLLLRFQTAGAKILRLPYFLACFRVHPAQKTSALLHNLGQREINLLRTRANGREITPAELENHPRLMRYLRRSAFIQLLWELGIHAR
jgi:glycosyltransferase involved in cell wall biosynthesis